MSTLVFKVWKSRCLHPFLGCLGFKRFSFFLLLQKGCPEVTTSAMDNSKKRCDAGLLLDKGIVLLTNYYSSHCLLTVQARLISQSEKKKCILKKKSASCDKKIHATYFCFPVFLKKIFSVFSVASVLCLANVKDRV